MSKTPMYKAATDSHELCKELLAENQEDKATKYRKLNKKKFLRMCIWLQLHEEDNNVSSIYE